MKHIYLYLPAILILLMVAACDKGATFEVHNQCSYPAWVSVDGDSLTTLAPGERRSYKISTDRETLISGTVYESFKVKVFGETFTLEKEVDGHLIPTDSTIVKIEAGETRKAPLLPNRACIKVTNNSSSLIQRAEIWKYKGPTQVPMGSIENVLPGSSKFQRVEYATSTNNFYYVVKLYVEGNDEPMYFGSYENVLSKDEQYHLIYADPEKKK